MKFIVSKVTRLADLTGDQMSDTMASIAVEQAEFAKQTNRWSCQRLHSIR